MPDETKVNAGFLNHLGQKGLSKEFQESVNSTATSKELSAIVFDNIIRVSQENPKSIEEAAMLFNQIKGIVQVII